MASPQAGSAQSIRPVYVLHGQDEYLRDFHRRQIVARALGDCDPQLGVTVFDGDAELTEVFDELRTPALMAPHRVVIVRNADKFVSTNRQALERYLDKPCPAASLVLVVGAWNRTHRLPKLVSKVGEAIDCSSKAVSNLPKWLDDAAWRRGKRLDRQAAQMLQEHVGHDLAALDAELEKLAAFVGQRQTISIEDVNELTAATAEPGDFALQNAIAAGRLPAALEALDGMMTRRGEEFRALGGIAWHLRTAARRRTGGRSIRKLHDGFRRVMAADLAMKSGADPRTVMQQLVVALCT
ncbi:MAG TPA: DNA polymerase III subunit delta [Phycisphaerae bacterium]|nr:DNA polymerase III subunit delta [Phycisphaerae bacterium]HUT56405.1 DNA polymerase III subunit delta [Phycisphaerae bacterium]